MNKNMLLGKKVLKVMKEKNIKQSDLAREVGVSRTAIYLQIKNLKVGKSIPLRTIYALERLSSKKILNV